MYVFRIELLLSSIALSTSQDRSVWLRVCLQDMCDFKLMDGSFDVKLPVWNKQLGWLAINVEQETNGAISKTFYRRDNGRGREKSERPELPLL